MKKFLIAIPSPRDILSVKEALDRVDFVDKFYVKYTRPEYLAYQQIQEFFLKNDYTHLIIWADDLIVELHHIYQLMEDVGKYDFPVIGGICQIDNDWYKDKMAISIKPLHPKRADRFRYFERFEDYYEPDNINLKPEFLKNPIIRTFWQGFPLTCIRQDVFNDLSFRNDSSFNDLPEELGCCLDDMFCWDCIQNEIPMWTDLRIRMNHLKINDNNSRMLFVNGNPHTEFVKKTMEVEIAG